MSENDINACFFTFMSSVEACWIAMMGDSANNGYHLGRLKRKAKHLPRQHRNNRTGREEQPAKVMLERPTEYTTTHS